MATKPPAPWKGFSFVYGFEAAGLRSATPVTVMPSFKKAPEDATPTIHWSAHERAAAFEALDTESER